MAKRQSDNFPLKPEDVVIEDKDYRPGMDRRVAYDLRGNPLIDVRRRSVKDSVQYVEGDVKMESEGGLVLESNLDRDYVPDITGKYDIVECAFDLLERGDRNIYVFNNLETGDSTIYFEEEEPDFVELSESIVSYLEGRYPVDVMGGSGENENIDVWERITWENIVHRALKES